MFTKLFSLHNQSKIMKQLLLVPIALLLIVQLSFGQYSGAKDGIGIRYQTYNYQLPITKEFDANQFTKGIEIEYVRHLNNALNLAVPFRMNKAEIPTDEKGSFTSKGMVSLDLLLQLKLFNESSFIYPYLYAGASGILEDFEDVDFAAPLGIGLNFRLARHAYLSTKTEYRVGFSDLRDNLQFGVGLLVLLGEGESKPKEPEISDRDGDGVGDNEDLCPDLAGVASLNGCPDADSDGIADGEDMCPDEPGSAALKGCPDADEDGLIDKDDECPTEAGPATNNGCPIMDGDGDGVADADDECPNEAGTLATNGCPDADKDGIADKDDLCPEAAGTISGRGCPDADGDGIADADDKCPDEVGPASNSGCPEIDEKDKETLEFAVQAVNFETAQAKLLGESYPILDKIVDILQRYPSYKLKVSGHTDSIGSSSTNQSLSEKRAKACYDYIISKGINSSRVSYVGYGESQPIADNRYKDGREKNRRVEFDVYLD